MWAGGEGEQIVGLPGDRLLEAAKAIDEAKEPAFQGILTSVRKKGRFVFVYWGGGVNP